MRIEEEGGGGGRIEKERAKDKKEGEVHLQVTVTRRQQVVLP